MARQGLRDCAVVAGSELLAEFPRWSTAHYRLRWGFSEHVGLLAAAGRGLRGASADEPEFMSYLGLQVVF